MTRLVVNAVLMFGLAAPAWAGFDEGLAAYKRGDYATALREFRTLAQQGEAKGQNGLGVMYARGQGVAQDDVEAVKWYRKSAEQGYASAQNNLGFMYSKGQGVAQDEAEAVKWHRKAAEQGHASAQYNLGVMYVTARDVTRDYIQAHMWLALAASLGNDLAVKYLGTIAKRMTSGQIADAQRLASEWMAKFEARGKKQ